MPNPYGMTELDVPGILAAYTSARQGRMQQMLLQRQMAREDKQLERETALHSAYSKIRAPGSGGMGSAYSPQGAASGGSPPATGRGTASATSAPEALPATSAVPASRAAAPETWMAANAALVGQLMAVDPKQASELAQSFRQMDEAQIKATQTRNQAIAVAAHHLSQLPADQRAAEYQRIAPSLIAQGVSEDMITQADLSDQGLRWAVAQGRDIEKIIESSQPKPREIDGVVFDDRTGKPIYQSPYPRIIPGPQGSFYEQPRIPGIPSGGFEAGPGSVTGEAPPPGTSGGLSNVGGLNNPGGLKDGQFARSQPGYKGARNGFAVFDSPQAGARAQETLLRSSYLSRPTTIRQVIERYAPRKGAGGDNSDASVNNYIAYVARQMGVPADQKIDATYTAPLAQAMREFETGHRPGKSKTKRRPTSKAEYDRLVKGARYVAPDGTERVKG